MNNSVISDENYKEGINELYSDAIAQYVDVPRVLLWEYIKIKIKEFTISYCILKCQSRRNEIKDIEEKLDFIDKSDKNDQTMLERRILKKQLDILYEQKARGYQIRRREK